MELNFTRLGKPDEYSIARNGEILFIAAYNKKEHIRELYNPDRAKVAQAFCYDSKSYKLVPDYVIQLITKENCEVLIRPQSVVRKIYFFKFEERQYFVISHVGCKYSIFKEGKRVAVYQACSADREDQNVLTLTDHNLCIELFCLLALYLHSDLDLILPKESRQVM